ncbi:hypothetical protein B0H63DRAFT_194397 [Podospora didyma]|uniref:Uncharacterized protein n=1 Tax=Podospora didyma TaxID=330526 RepID=A0AAE0TVE9_9PEZI|nr:hypothetical protein B0H63DRAFT_194397 [Podospora didyma]
MKVSITLPIFLLQLSSTALAASCSGCANNKQCRYPDDLKATARTLCQQACAGDGDYIFTVNGNEGGDTAQFHLQPHTCPSHCVSAMNDIFDQCIGGGCTSGTWELDGQWYWVWAKMQNGANGCEIGI